MTDVLLSASVADGYRFRAWCEPNTDLEMPTDDQIDASNERGRAVRSAWIDGPSLPGAGELEGMG